MSLTQYTLKADGDGYEQYYCDIFLNQDFPSYEKFWQKNITSLTNRPSDVHFKSDAELKKIGKNDENICIAQLHYTLFRHLVRLYEIRQILPLHIDQFSEGITRSSAALDLADELLERWNNLGYYDAWSEKDGKKARENWRKTEKSMSYLRNYRNRLLHGRVIPGILVMGTYNRLRVPKFSKVENYLDWRFVTSASVGSGGKVRTDFDSPNNLLNQAWVDIVKYLENNWKKNLL